MSQAPAKAGGTRSPLRIQGTAEPADLEVTIVDKTRDERSFECTVSSPLLPSLQSLQPEEWKLTARTGEIVSQYMGQFAKPGIDADSRLLALQGAGVELWDIAPAVFKDAYDVLEKEGREIRTIQITSEESNIPWELMIPRAPDPRSLGVRHSIARWFVGGSPLPAAGRPARDARVAAPANSVPPKRLPMAAPEAELVCKALKGRKLDAANAAKLLEQLEQWRGTILHFVCHGIGGQTQELCLDGPARLTAAQVAGMFPLSQAWAESAPVVFMNACRVGQPAPTLNGAGGLVRSWTRVGAGAVIAPLWSVSDEIAHAVAVEFYRRLEQEPTVPYAEIMRDIRALANSERHDSYAAYCYFGSPWAAAA